MAWRIELPTHERLVDVLGRYWAEDPAVWDLFEKSVAAHDRIKPIDVLSLGALNARLTMRGMTELWHFNAADPERTRQRVQSLVAKVTKSPLESLSKGEIQRAARALGAAATELDAVTYWGDTRVAKLLYRLRPRLAPIWDKYVGSYYASFRKEDWGVWYEDAMFDIKRNHTALRRAIAECGPPYNQISPVRAWDIVLWSGAARKKRSSAARRR